jgi:hypothetical protein
VKIPWKNCDEMAQSGVEINNWASVRHWPPRAPLASIARALQVTGWAVMFLDLDQFNLVPVFIAGL